ncbi:hypothetical protein M1B72_20870 [Geomonas paludis]|uniref:Uncharacterized protein n=1 Tax=Geomonas paludis TaxID=2740185 RepID=A0A6V8MSB8_9BACT|nr:hypothetical protein [Geomonas paludis]UPU35863.1 hypothetical protein M1B72_20870 [Geomonas paludis]GFO62553.1 hypothetical protein GMPD_04720 [Geomonas paludis]
MKTFKNLKAILFAIIAISLTHISTAAHAQDTDPTGPRGKCPYALQLQKSVEAQKAYLVKVERAKASNPIQPPEEVAAASPEQAPAQMTDHLSVAWISFTWGSRTN